MIKSKEGRVQIKGNAITIMAELCAIVKSMKDSGISEEEIRNAVDLGLLSNEELDMRHKEAMEKHKERVKGELKDILEEIFG